MDVTIRAQIIEGAGSRIEGISKPRTTHSQMTPEELAQSGIRPNTIRLSIGLEDPQDLIADLQRALKAAEKAGGKAAHAQSHSSKAGA